jgi:glycosyltransferase involved in cell wall biosynthesis
MTARPHVCFVSPTIYPLLVESGPPVAGGAEVQQVMIARALRGRGHRVSVLTSGPAGSRRTVVDGIEVHCTPPVGTRGLPGLRRIHPRLTEIVAGLRRIDPDVVYFRSASGILAACAWYARRSGRRLFYAAAHDHDFLPGRIFGLERRELLLYRAGLRWCDEVIVQNRQQQALLRERFGRDARVVPNCYAERGARPGSADGPVLWVGTVKPVKWPELFLDLASRCPGRRFVMVGGPASERPAALEYYRGIEAQARRHANVDFTGFVPFGRVGALYDGACVLVNTSMAEGFPNTFLQAWVRGVPSVSFVAPAIGDDATGTICCDDLDGMARALARLLHDRGAWAEASSRAMRHFERTHSVEAVHSLYENLLASAPLHGRAGLARGRA